MTRISNEGFRPMADRDQGVRRVMLTGADRDQGPLLRFYLRRGMTLYSFPAFLDL